MYQMQCGNCGITNVAMKVSHQLILQWAYLINIIHQNSNNVQVIIDNGINRPGNTPFKTVQNVQKSIWLYWRNHQVTFNSNCSIYYTNICRHLYKKNFSKRPSGVAEIAHFIFDASIKVKYLKTETNLVQKKSSFLDLFIKVNYVWLLALGTFTF